MKRPYGNIGFFFIVLFAMVMVGFTPPIPETPFFGYFSQLTVPESIPAVIHVHAVSAVLFFLILISQPFLIRANRPDLHRILGKSSIAVAIFLVVTGLQVLKHFHAKAIQQMPNEAVLSLMAQQFTPLILFSIFYTIAFLKRRNIHHHVAFMIGASLAVATPGLARFGLYVIGGLPGILMIVVLIYLTLISFMVHAKRRFQVPVLRGPYLPVIALFLAAHVMDFAGGRTAAWQWIASQIVSIW